MTWNELGNFCGLSSNVRWSPWADFSPSTNQTFVAYKCLLTGFHMGEGGEGGWDPPSQKFKVDIFFATQ